MDYTDKKFLHALAEIETILFGISFKKHSFIENGFSYFIGYKKDNNTIVEFLYGPSEYQIEMIVHAGKGKFAFKDLLQISGVAKWVNGNRYKEEGRRNLKNELLWYVE